jgi:tetratricopeptide (TPR) repeat protein
MTNGKKKSAARKQPARESKGTERQLTCFVVTGFGNKTDYSTGRVLNLDKTYEQLVRPACDKVNVNCFRAIDANLTGSIDSIMYRWIYEAEAAKKNKNFSEAIRLFGRAIEMQTEKKPDKKPDVFLAQRLALVTYKEGEKQDAEGKIDKEVASAALNEAEDILAKYCAPKISNDPETLGLSGAINKRLFELTGDLAYLDRAIGFYERGFYVKQDYYNGINVAYMYTQRANLLSDRFDAIVSYGHANMIRQNVVEICKELIEDEESFANRGDKQWVYMTLAEAYQGLGLTSDEERLGRKIESEATEFGKDSYLKQKAKLKEAIDEFERRVRPAELSAKPAAGGAKSEEPMTTTQLHPAVTSNPNVITIDADIMRGKPIKSIDVNCRIEYA